MEATSSSARILVLACALWLAVGCASGSNSADVDAAVDDEAQQPIDAATPDAGPPDAPAARCGDGIIDPSAESCDDGNTITEECDYDEAACTVCDEGCAEVAGATSRCGDALVDPAESCDDGNTVTEVCAYGIASCTVCNAMCAEVAGVASRCGDHTTDAPLEACDDGNTATEACPYGVASCTVCDGSCALSAGAAAWCGDGSVQAAESCDDGNTAVEACAYGATSCSVCGSTCQASSGVTRYCGDGILQSSHGESCDDGDTNAGDGCAPGCTRERFELEPNEDGSPSIGGIGIVGNDFGSASASTNAVLQMASGRAVVVGALVPAGDEDVYAVASAGVSRAVTIETTGPDGYTGCVGLDTGIVVRDADGDELARDDDGGTGLCSRLTFVVPANATVYVHVTEFNDNASIARYFLAVTP